MILDKYCVSNTSTMFEAIQKIDNNQKGFVVVINNFNKIQGTVTDGDIRRSLLNSISIDVPITKVMVTEFAYVYDYDNFEKLINLFKNSKIDFLPVLSSDNQLVNILTKKQLHTALLEGIEWDLHYDFSTLDELKIDHEIFNRPWGYYKTVFLSEYSQAKIIQVNPGGQLSLQEHKKREEHWVIVKGKGLMRIGESVKIVSEGTYIYIPKACKHTISNTSSSEPLMISEVQLGSYFGEDDIIRYEDIYGRLDEK